MSQRRLLSVSVAVFIAACSSTGTRVGSARGPDAGVANARDGAQADAATSLSVCSGCPSESRDRGDLVVRFHHAHLNVVDPAASRAYYRKLFAAQPVRLNDKSDGLWLAPMLFLFHQVSEPPNDTLEMGLDHVGRGSDDPVQWFDHASELGAIGDPRQGFQATPAQVAGFTFVYLRGPDAERTEVYSSGTVVIPDHRDQAETFQHVHLLTADVDATVAWYSQLLELPADPNSGLGRDIVVDQVALFFASYPLPNPFVASDDRPLGHIALSVSDLDRMRERAGMLGVEIVAEPSVGEEGFRSFFVRAPELVLLEFVEAGPLDLAH